MLCAELMSRPNRRHRQRECHLPNNVVVRAPAVVLSAIALPKWLYFVVVTRMHWIFPGGDDHFPFEPNKGPAWNDVSEYP